MTSNMLTSFCEKHCPLGPCRSLQIWCHSLWFNCWPEWRAKQCCIVWKSKGKTVVKAPSLSKCRESGVSSITLSNDHLLPFPINILSGTVNHSRHIGWARNPFPFLSTKPVTEPKNLPGDHQENGLPLTFFPNLSFTMSDYLMIIVSPCWQVMWHLVSL